ncbi:site-specific integrase [Bacteroidales bacterium OttesenSCG-928-I21]|nr:site-specific integrase [Bacteroidales bacterium OttesenSCG-928-I21]
MVTIKIYLRKHSKNTNEGIVWISFYVNREKINFSTKVKCDTKNWNEKKCCIAAGDKLAGDKNLVIERISARINDVFVKFRLKNKKITRDSFLRAYNRPDDYDTFFDFIKENQKKICIKNELSTMHTHTTVIKKLKEYAPNLHFDDITTDLLDEYYAYLRKELNNNDNTAYKNMSTFKKYVNAAFKAGYLDENPFADWKIKRITSNYTYFDESEIGILLSIYKEGELELKLHKTLEFLLFMCFSSLHIGDAKKLKLEQFTTDSFTYYRIKNKNKKPEPIVVPVSNTLRMLIKNIVGFRQKGLIFEHLPADQTMNRYLKEIGIIAGINKKITHKTARHTFATYFLYKTKDLTALKEILGHSELRETLIYAHVLDESKQEGIKCFDSFEL